MGLFDIFKKKESLIENKDKIIPINQITIQPNPSQKLVPFLGKLLIPENIRQLLWFDDGEYKNYNPENDQKILFENELFRITFSFQKEPSLISTRMPIDFGANLDNVEKLGYYPSYENLSPKQRFVYLKWLCDITKPVDIGYVFIFYYGFV